MKLFSKIVFLTFAFLLVLSCAQRGGSRSKQSSDSSSSRSSYRSSNYHQYGGSHYGANGNCTTVNGTTFCTYQDGEVSWTLIIIVFSIFAVLIGFGINAAVKDEERRKRVIEQAMKKYEYKMEEWAASLSPSEKARLVDQFMKKSYTMVVNVKDKDQKFFCQLKVTDFKKENEDKYIIKMNGKDQVGPSKFEGLLMFTADGLGLKLSKVYDDRTKAEQTGSFDILLYEGAGSPEKIAGEWAFHGHQSSLLYSGNWTMMEL